MFIVSWQESSFFYFPFKIQNQPIMKSTIFSLVALLLFSFTAVKAQNDNAVVVKEFLKSIPAAAAEKISANALVATVDAIAKKTAAKTISLTKENIAYALAEAKQFKFGIIVVGEHTFVKISDFGKCNASGSWGACMPDGEGYIKKGALVSQQGYINNIIGRPDAQVRTLYLFN